jgi:hypothetical protein
MANKGNRVLSGNEGEVWLNGDLLGDLKSIELKVTGNFEDVNFCGDNATYQRYMGWTGEGSIKLQKSTSRGAKLLANAFKTGIMPDIKIITKLRDLNTGNAERVSVEDVTITEFMLTNFESKSLIEEELPLKFATYNVIETL